MDEHSAAFAEQLFKELRADNARLRDVIAALVSDVVGSLPAGVADYDDDRYCIYCDARNVYHENDHKIDCPIIKGRRELREAGERDG